MTLIIGDGDRWIEFVKTLRWWTSIVSSSTISVASISPPLTCFATARRRKDCSRLWRCCGLPVAARGIGSRPTNR